MGPREGESSCPCGHLEGSSFLLEPLPVLPHEAASVGSLAHIGLGRSSTLSREYQFLKEPKMLSNFTADSGRDLKAGAFGQRALRFGRSPNMSYSFRQPVMEVLRARGRLP